MRSKSRVSLMTSQRNKIGYEKRMVFIQRINKAYFVRTLNEYLSFIRKFNIKERKEKKMGSKKLVVAIFLAVSFCFVSGAGYGKVPRSLKKIDER